VLLLRPARYVLAGALYAVALTASLLLCILPGFAIGLVMPAYCQPHFHHRGGGRRRCSARVDAVCLSPRAGLDLCGDPVTGRADRAAGNSVQLRPWGPDRGAGGGPAERANLTG